MTHSRSMALIGGLTMWLTPTILQAGPIEASRHPHPKNIEMVHGRNIAWTMPGRCTIVRRWEARWRPRICKARIEQHLHEARTLVPQARGPERGDSPKVERLVGKIQVVRPRQSEQGAEEMTPGLSRTRVKWRRLGLFMTAACAVSDLMGLASRPSRNLIRFPWQPSRRTRP